MLRNLAVASTGLPKYPMAGQELTRTGLGRSQMLGAVVAKLAMAQSTLLISSLLLVIARLVHLHLPELVQCLAAMPAPAGAHPLCWALLLPAPVHAELPILPLAPMMDEAAAV